MIEINQKTQRSQIPTKKSQEKYRLNPIKSNQSQILNGKIRDEDFWRVSHQIDVFILDVLEADPSGHLDYGRRRRRPCLSIETLAKTLTLDPLSLSN